MKRYYTCERSVQILISLLKQHNIKKVIASPGTTNITFVESLRNDSFFEIYSSADERSAGYMACGLASEAGEPVVISCTGATASRNYIPALTEAYYRKIPVLAVTSSQHLSHSGHNIPQMIDRTVQLNDMVKLSVQVPTISSEEDEWATITSVNNALLELRRDSWGPVHINLVTTGDTDFGVKELPTARKIERYNYSSTELPIVKKGRVAIFVGAHKPWSDELTQATDAFCEKYNGVVICDQTSNYRGKYRVLANIVTGQKEYNSPCLSMDLMIHIGDISGAYMKLFPKKVWRVNPDGELRDTFKKLCCIFEMDELSFFHKYVNDFDLLESGENDEYFNAWNAEIKRIRSAIPELPFSNDWAASITSHRLPVNCSLHLGILNSLRAWNMFETPAEITCFCNTGGFGIDGILSTVIGSSLVNKEKLYYCVVGDLAFFYDMNSLGNRHLNNNLRIMLVNNGKGTEFRNYSHPASRLGSDADYYIAAAGHYGNKSGELVKHYAQDLGFEYFSASNKDQFMACIERFITPEITEKPMLFELFTDSENESDALYAMQHIVTNPALSVKEKILNSIGEENYQRLRRLKKKL